MQISKGQEVEINVVGSNLFGRYPKISLEETWNLFISNEWMVNYAGFKKVIDLLPMGEGRGLFYSVRGQFMLAIISSTVYKISANLNYVFIGNIPTTTGDVYMDENLTNQICIVDGYAAYIYNYAVPSVPALIQQTLTFSGETIIPSYVCYHNTYFLIGSSPSSKQNPAFWYVCSTVGGSPPVLTNNLTILKDYSIQSKPDNALVVKRLPGKGSNVLVMGSTVCEVWTQTASLSPTGIADLYKKVQSFSIDYGLVSIATLATTEEFLCWLGYNESNSPCIMFTNGGELQRLSTDGIDQRLDQIQFPQQSNGFFYRQDGHVFYQITFYNPADNLSLLYDFTTQKFFFVSDQNLNFHPARQICFFDETTYFISLVDGSIYWMDTTFVTYDYSTSPTSIGEEIPRIRICKSIRQKNSDRFRLGQFTFTIEQGVVPANALTPARVDMSMSKNGGQSFGSVVSRTLNPVGIYRNQIRWWRCGQANDLIIQLRFYGFQRFVVGPAIAEIY